MGTWSEFVKTHTPKTNLDLTQISKTTLAWIRDRGTEDFHELVRLVELGKITFEALGHSFCDTARIWGYLTNNTQEILDDIAKNIDTPTADLIFSTDADNITYFRLLFNFTTGKCYIQISRTRNYPENIDLIDWVSCGESEIFKSIPPCILFSDLI